ncbi:MAG TPA: pyrroloquinoline quinone biosynthesis protein PqqB, partial [Acidobacteria bacterium]|nr:pyrroloquinoline quinone biosynthesis protein PqqB [Acidobacteriota bacterium]
GESFSPLPGIQVRAIAVPHRQEYSDTVAFRIRGPHRTVLFVPDIDSWERQPGLLEQLVEDIDVAYLDATWYDGRELPGRDMSEIPHPTMVHTMELLAEQAASNPGRFRFIHLNHTNPALLDQALQEQIEARGFRIAQREERVGL